MCSKGYGAQAGTKILDAHVKRPLRNFVASDITVIRDGFCTGESIGEWCLRVKLRIMSRYGNEVLSILGRLKESKDGDIDYQRFQPTSVLDIYENV